MNAFDFFIFIHYTLILRITRKKYTHNYRTVAVAYFKLKWFLVQISMCLCVCVCVCAASNDGYYRWYRIQMHDANIKSII